MPARKKTKSKAPEEANADLIIETQDTTDKTAEISDMGPGPAASFPIVGIGASAGGLAAFEAFFSGMPADIDPGMAFVLVQHLAPDHKSILTELIRRYTRMKVYEVEDGMAVKPNCAYIIPPNKDMAFLNGTLQLMEPSAPRGQRLPIDFFFRSLALDQHERAICIVLSGTGADGTSGLRAIKGEGGLTIAQDPASTEYDGMPRSAITTGLVDYILPPAEMASQLIAYAMRAFGKRTEPATVPAPKAENALKKIFVVLRSHTGHDFSLYKPSTINRRIERRMAVHQIETIEGYVRYLQQTQVEVENLFRDLLIGVTNFFRDPEAFKMFEERVVSKLFTGKSAEEAVRIWCPGCSTGEEPYSIAMLLQEHMETIRQSFKVQIFATDIDNQAITTARAGLYSAGIASDVSPERLARFFTSDAEGVTYRINKNIRDMLIFSEQDLIKDPPFSKLDVIVCRNLLIYMGGALQKKLIPMFHYALNPNGYLFLGTSETVGDFYNLFSALDRKLKLYQRKEDIHNAQRADVGRFMMTPVTATEMTLQQPAGKPPLPVRQSLRELTVQTLLQHMPMTGALVNGQGDIFYIHGRSGMYLEPASGETGTNNIIKMAREGLRREMAISLHKAAGGNEIVRRPGLQVKTNGDYTAVDLTIRPVTTGHPSPNETPLYLAILEEAPHQDAEQARMAATQAVEGPDAAPDIDTQIMALKNELRTKEEYLHTANEELETSNEELKSSNEELQSVNEELQSTNEELETSKEELQSLNEELSTVNSELQTKVADLTQANNDMNNLLAGTGIATIFVGHAQQILRFTPASTQIINLIPGDVGRPVGHIVSNMIGYDRLPADTQAVLDTLIHKEVEVQTKAGLWYSMRIQPYRTLENVIEGAVITFIDITSLKKMQEALKESETRFQAVMKGAAVIVAHIDRDLRYVWIYNPQEGFDAAPLIGKRDDEIAANEGSRKLMSLKRRAIESGEGARARLPLSVIGGEKVYDVVVEPIKDGEGVVIGATTTAFEVIERARQ
jgi:two-component system, chemotaxis family, CheB/CheR fusion protein